MQTQQLCTKKTKKHTARLSVHCTQYVSKQEFYLKLVKARGMMFMGSISYTVLAVQGLTMFMSLQGRELTLLESKLLLQLRSSTMQLRCSAGTPAKLHGLVK